MCQIRNKLVFFFAVFFIALLPAFSAAQGSQSTYVPREVVVKLNQASDLSAVTQQYGLQSVPLGQIGGQPIFRLQAPAGVDIDELVASLQNDPSHRVALAEPNYIFGTPGAGNVPWSLGGSWSIGGSWGLAASRKGYETQWMRSRINLAPAQAITQGQDIRIAVLDTGIDLQHPAFAGKLLPGYDFVDNDNDPSEVGSAHVGAYGHGTHVAGIITMVAPRARIIPIRVMDQNGVCDVWRLAKALIYAANPDGDITTNDGAKIINLSLGTPQRSDLIKKVVTALTNNGSLPDDPDLPTIVHPGIVVVAAAGNTGNTTRIYPAAAGEITGIVAVGASTPTDTMAQFSTRGEWIEIMAPGERIVSTVPGGRYGVWRGTSMAAPIVAGVAALVRQRFPSLGPEDVFDQIRRSAVVCSGTLSRRVDAEAAVTLVP